MLGLILVLQGFKQSVEFGFRYMPTLSNLNLKTLSGATIQGEATYDFGEGIFLGINFSKHVGFQVEAIYSSVVQKYQEPDFEQDIRMRDVNIPLLLSLNTSKSKAINLGIVGGAAIWSAGGEQVVCQWNERPRGYYILDRTKLKTDAIYIGF